MGKYTKKGVTIEAVKWTGENREEINDFCGSDGYITTAGDLNIKTLEGELSAKIGDMIIKGIKGEFYPCKPDIFEATYSDFKGPFSFGRALEALETGHRCYREGWHGKDMFVFLVNGSNFKVNREPLLSILGDGTEVNYNPHIDIKQPSGDISTWVPSIGDALAKDWRITTF